MSGVGARQVGEFIINRPMIKTVRNPLDKATVVSIYPKPMQDEKWTVFPGKYRIEAGSLADPAILVVDPTSWWRDIDIEQPLIEIPVAANQVAHSFITDYVNGFLAVDMATQMPGLFYINGEVTKLEVIAKYKNKLQEAKMKQDLWFKALVRLGDSLWARSNGNPLVIWDEMRLAARELGMESLPWMRLDVQAAMTRCFACGSLRNPEFPICPTCKNVDMTHPRAKDIKLAVG